MPADHPILAGLNDRQTEVVTSDAKGLLVIAGAGSGKTRVLTSRIAWLMQERGVPASSILAVTFTNKAAKEMRNRVSGMAGAATGLWIGTFHAISNRLLSTHWKEAGFIASGYQVIDDGEQRGLVKQILRRLDLNDRTYEPRAVQGIINRFKEKGMRADAVSSPSPQERASFEPMKFDRVQEVYRLYEEMCERNNLVDFAEMMLRCCELLAGNEQIREQYRHKFQHVLLDEFQDADQQQYHWLKLLCSPSSQCALAVGDDDQSIYGWRGARVENMNKFESDYSATVHRLEQNYRSDGNILKAANSVIAKNKDRYDKKMWTDSDDGEPITLYHTQNDYNEADCLVERAQAWKTAGGKFEEVAVLYRSRAQSRVLESVLLKNKIPYVMYGGTPFYQRTEVKDVLSYLRLIVNRNDDVAFIRAIGAPKRGVGGASMDKLRAHAEQIGGSLWVAANEMCAQGQFGGKISGGLKEMMNLIEDLDPGNEDITLVTLTKDLIERSDLKAHYEHTAKDKEEVRGRLDNLDELINACSTYDEEAIDPLTAEPVKDIEAESVLERFLTAAQLDADQVATEEGQDCVNLMTMHSAKGLEFPLVFVAGMVDGLVPNARAVDEDPRNIQEERRLCYVAMTRACKVLCLSTFEYRRTRGTILGAMPSPFLSEIPKELLVIEKPLRAQIKGAYHKYASSRDYASANNEDVTLKAASAAAGNNTASDKEADGGYRIGSTVSHSRFGTGTIMKLEGADEHARAGVQFENTGFKWLVLSYARLTLVK